VTNCFKIPCVFTGDEDFAVAAALFVCGIVAARLGRRVDYWFEIPEDYPDDPADVVRFHVRYGCLALPSAADVECAGVVS
jgi:hypothetical protein